MAVGASEGGWRRSKGGGKSGETNETRTVRSNRKGNIQGTMGALFTKNCSGGTLTFGESFIKFSRQTVAFAKSERLRDESAISPNCYNADKSRTYALFGKSCASR
jgi:hypothetical protein